MAFWCIFFMNDLILDFWEFKFIELFSRVFVDGPSYSNSDSDEGVVMPWK